MLKIESLDKRYQSRLTDLEKLAKALLQKLENGQLKAKKPFPRKARFALELYLVNKKKLNKNVYAYQFPKDFPYPQKGLTPLGEIYLNPSVIKEQKLSLARMLIHGFLHLIGYEHETKSDTIAMETKESSLLKELFPL